MQIHGEFLGGAPLGAFSADLEVIANGPAAPLELHLARRRVEEPVDQHAL